jgi:hypothetical protein
MPGRFPPRPTAAGCGLLLAAALLAPPPSARAGPPPKLRVSDDRRSLVTLDGRPFFYLADTAWELFHRADRAQAAAYLTLRAGQRFTVIQAVALAEVNGPNDPNAHGDLPFIDKDPTRPAVTPGADPDDPGAYDYWDHVDYVVDEANRLGLYVALLPSWGSWVNNVPPRERVLTAANARPYGEFLGKRYGGKGVIWVLGGDRTGQGFEAVWRALAKGVAVGAAGREDYDAVLMTYHPGGGHTSAAWFHDDPWLDFNMQQTGHGPAARARGWDKVAADYARTPVKPVVDGEPLYEDHPIGFRAARENGFSFDAHVRQRAYWHVFAGACGVAYGNHAVWQMYAPGRRPINGPLFYWTEAVHRPGAAQMRFVRALVESRPVLSRVPDQSVLADALDGPDRIQAARGDGYLFAYTGSGRPVRAHMGKVAGARVKAHWFNPRNGAVTEIGTFDNTGTRDFTPPFEGFGSDWVLVLDDEAKGYGPPGQGVHGR